MSLFVNGNILVNTVLKYCSSLTPQLIFCYRQLAITHLLHFKLTLFQSVQQLEHTRITLALRLANLLINEIETHSQLAICQSYRVYRGIPYIT